LDRKERERNRGLRDRRIRRQIGRTSEERKERPRRNEEPIRETDVGGRALKPERVLVHCGPENRGMPFSAGLPLQIYCPNGL